MTRLSRRGLFGVIGGGLLASAAPQVLFWHQSPWNVSYLVSTLEARLQDRMESNDFYYTPEELKAHKQRDGSPEYQRGSA